MVFSFFYAVFWGFCLLGARCLGWIDTADVVAFLGYITTLSGAGFFMYFKGVKDEKENDVQ